MAKESTAALIELAVRRVQEQVPALEPLKLVVGLELRGRGDIQLYRVELPGPRISKDPATDAKVRVSIARSHFNELAREGRVGDWQEAFENGHARASGPEQILRLVANVTDRSRRRARSQR